ncbi:MAG: YheT family hydrolase [Burkholderiales bacterium]
MNYQAPWWLPGGHAQTIWPALFAMRSEQSAPVYRRERWATPDADFIDVDFSEPCNTPARGLLVLFHGLEGSSASHYALAFADYARRSGLSYAVVHFRGCSGEVNRAPRAYHSGDFEEIDWILRRMRQRANQQGHAQLLAVGISLGGNALMRWAGELEVQASTMVQALAAVSAPLDLTASGKALGQGLNRYIYTPMFLRSMKPRALQRWQLHPGLFDCQRMRSARNLYEFDNVFTAPVHGFKDAFDYWQRASAKPHLQRIRVPSLLLNSANDPFIPAHSLPQPHEVSRQVTLWQPGQGGHVGYASGNWPAHLQAMTHAVGGFLCQHLAMAHTIAPDAEKIAVYG